MAKDAKDSQYTLNTNTMEQVWEHMKQIHDSPNLSEQDRNKAWNEFDKLVGEYNAQSTEDPS